MLLSLLSLQKCLFPFISLVLTPINTSNVKQKTCKILAPYFLKFEIVKGQFPQTCQDHNLCQNYFSLLHTNQRSK